MVDADKFLKAALEEGGQPISARSPEMMAAELVQLIRAATLATIESTKKANEKRGYLTAARAEEKAVKALFQFVTGRKPTGDELRAMVGN
jgi:HEPN domain-containing protein